MVAGSRAVKRGKKGTLMRQKYNELLTLAARSLALVFLNWLSASFKPSEREDSDVIPMDDCANRKLFVIVTPVVMCIMISIVFECDMCIYD